MLDFPIENRAHLAPEAFEPIASALARQTSIKQALDWLRKLEPPRAPIDLVTQDEYSHDILVPFADGLFLAYDCT